MMAVMFKGIVSFVIAVGILCLADQYFYDGRHVEVIVSMVRGIAS
jgi:hypothetical protein